MNLVGIKEKLNEYFWRLTSETDENVKCLEIENAPSFSYANDHISDPATAEFMHSKNWMALPGALYLLNRTCIIEPSHSYAIVGFNKIVRQTIFFHHTKPSTSQYLKYRLLNTGREISLDEAVIFDGNLGVSYFHFFADVMNKLWVLERHNFDEATPLIIARRVFECKYFQYLYHNTTLKNRNWLIQNEEDFITCRSLYVVNPAPYNKLYWDKTVGLVENIRSNAEPFRRLFLTRPEGLLRSLSNTESIMPIIKKHGFEVVDPGALNFEEQVKLFSEARIIIGVHGAALTNMIFAQSSRLRILEIMSTGRTSGQLYWLAMMLKVEYYDIILAGPLVNSNFEISAQVFEKALLLLIGPDIE
jgi:hypothetical protein